jgi:hypothetical protein
MTPLTLGIIGTSSILLSLNRGVLMNICREGTKKKRAHQTMSPIFFVCFLGVSR